MCVLNVKFGSKERPTTFRCVAMGSEVLFMLRSRLCVYYAGSGVDRVQVVLTRFCVRLLCFIQGKKLWLYVFLRCTHACVCRCDDDIICVGHDLNRCSEWW